MRKWKALIALSLKSMLSTLNLRGRGKKKPVSGIAALALLAFIAVYISGVYSSMIAAALAPVGLAHLVILLMSVLAVVLCFTFTIFAAQGVIFGGKDNDLMLSLPIPPFMLMLCRTLALYVENLVFSVFVMIPAGVAYLVAGGGTGGALFLVRLLVCAVLLALLPTALSLAVGAVVAWVSSKFKRQGILGTVLYTVFFLLLMAFMMYVSFSMEDLAAQAAGLEAAFTGWGVPFLLTVDAACRGDLLALLLLSLLCLAPFLILVWLFGRAYKKIVTGLSSRAARSDYRLGRLSASGSRRALLRKEAKKFFGTPIYFLNAGIGLVMLLLGSVAAIFFRDNVEEVLIEIADAGAEVPIFPLLTVAACFLLSMTELTACSISLEGRQLWILKEAPIPAGGIFAVKVGFQLLLELPCLAVSTLCLAIAFSLTPVQALLFFLAGASVGTCTALLGLMVNLALPKLDAPNDTVVVKQSASVLVCTLGGMALVGLAALLYVLCQGALGELAVLVPIGALLVLSALALGLLRSVGVKLFERL